MGLGLWARAEVEWAGPTCCDGVRSRLLYFCSEEGSGPARRPLDVESFEKPHDALFRFSVPARIDKENKSCAIKPRG